MNLQCCQLTLFTVAISTLIAACGGRGGDAAPITLSGISAVGVAFGGARVNVKDKSGASQDCGTTAEGTGLYSCTLPATFTTPFLVSAERDGEKYFSAVTELTEGKATAQITPLTHAIVASLATNGQPESLAPEVITKAAIAEQVSKLQVGLASVISATLGPGQSINPLIDAIEAGSSQGMDKLLDAVKVSITGGSVGIALRANLESAMTLDKSAAPTPIPDADVQAVKATVDAEPPKLITALLKRMNACYALPPTSRVAKTDGTGTATDVLGICREVFIDGDPANFKSGGNTVSAKAAFKTLFSASANGLVFDRGNLEYVVNSAGAANNGFWVVSYRATATDGTVSPGVFVLKLQGGQLKQAGNQYEHDSNVSAFVQNREFINASGNNYWSTGYSLSVNNRVVNGSSIYKQVVVTSPKGKTFTLKPLAGCSYLGLVVGTKTSCTSFVRLSYGYQDASKAVASASDMPTTDQSYLAFVPTPMPDAELAQIPDQGTWLFEIELKSGETFTQKHRTLSRAPTLADVKNMPFVSLTKGAKEDLQTNSQSAGTLLVSRPTVFNFGRDNGADAWETPSGALAPTTATLFGNAPVPSGGGTFGNSFNDSIAFPASYRKVSIPCSTQSNADLHCDSSVPGHFAQGSRITEFQLNAPAARSVTRSKHFVLYNPNPASSN